MSAPIPVTTVGGYLGAGKTTLINAMLRHAGGRRLAVLVNEFGALPIDEDLIEAQDGDIISIAGGCICCSFGNDLIGALQNLAALDPAPDHILIEASGVAIPGSIAANMSLLPGCQRNGVVVLADAETVRATSQDKYLGDTILRQLNDADLVVVTKPDLIPASGLQEVFAWLEQVAAQAKIVAAQHGRIAVDVVLGPPGSGAAVAPGQHADALFESVVIPCAGAVNAKALAARLSEADLGLVRAKGFVRDLSGTMALIQVVGRRWDVFPAPADAEPAVVCIAAKGQMPEAKLRRAFDPDIQQDSAKSRTSQG